MLFISILRQYVTKVGLAVGLLFFVFASYVSAADVSVTPSSGSYSVGQTFTATIQALPAGDSINAVEAVVGFDSTVLQVVSVSKDGSAFSLWTTEPTFSNSGGTVTFGGGSPTPFSSNSNLLNITFRTLAAGEGTVSFNSASVLAADGLGTDVLGNTISATYTVAGEAIPEPEPEPIAQPDPEPEPEPEPEDNDATIAFGDPPRAPEVGSAAFLDPEIWYNITDGIFTWALPFDVNVVAVEMATSSENQPDENEDAVFDPPIEEFVVSSENVKDGIQYLSVKFKNQVGWGTVLNRKIMIDTTPPEQFPINVVAANKANAFPRLTFEASDKTSGIEKYEMFVADQEPFEVTPDEAKIGYLLRDLIDGTYTVKVVAHDMAGNTTESSVAVLIMAGWTPPVDEEEKWSFWSLFTGTNLTFLLLFIIVILQFVYIWYERKHQREREEKLRRETREIQDQMEKIFSALRDEIYDQINTITKRKRLSKKEKEAVEGLNQALEVSETLIEKEINDVKSILK